LFLAIAIKAAIIEGVGADIACGHPAKS